MSCVQWGKPHTVEWGVPSEGGMRKGERTWGHKYLVPPDGISFHTSIGWFWEPPPRLLCFTRFRWVLCWAIGIATSACPTSICGGKMECLHHVHETLYKNLIDLLSPEARVLSSSSFSQTFQNAVYITIFLFPHHPYYLTQTVLCKTFRTQQTSSELILFWLLSIYLYCEPFPSFRNTLFLASLPHFFLSVSLATKSLLCNIILQN